MAHRVFRLHPIAKRYEVGDHHAAGGVVGIVQERRNRARAVHVANDGLAVLLGQAAQHVGGDVGARLVEDVGENGRVERRRELDGVLYVEALEHLPGALGGQAAGDSRLGLAVQVLKDARSVGYVQLGDGRGGAVQVVGADEGFDDIERVGLALRRFIHGHPHRRSWGSLGLK